MVNFNRYSTRRLEAMLEAGREVLECQKTLARTGDNIVSELLPADGSFFEFDHCPAGDIFDQETDCQFYYHAHREGEHGHFHIFMRERGMPRDCRPAKQTKAAYLKKSDGKIAHLVAISMDAHGIPTRLFTTNRWVTAENWYGAKEVCKMVDRFAISHAKPSWPVNRWVTAMVRLFRPQIGQLLRKRDVVMRQWQKEHPGEDAFEDTDLVILSLVHISVEEQFNAIAEVLNARAREAAPRKSEAKAGKDPAERPKKQERSPRRVNPRGAGAAPA